MKSLRGLFYGGCLLLLISCSSEDRPSWVLGHDQMVEIMKEFYLADAIVQEYKGDLETKRKYREKLHNGILELYDLKREDFFKSYQFYIDHPYLLDTITNQVVEELNAQVPVEKERMSKEAVDRLKTKQDSVAKAKLKAGASEVEG